MFDFIKDVTKAAVSLPIAIVYDTVTMGGALTERDEPATFSVARKTFETFEELLDDE